MMKAYEEKMKKAKEDFELNPNFTDRNYWKIPEQNDEGDIVNKFANFTIEEQKLLGLIPNI